MKSRKRLDPLERFARRICWLEFNGMPAKKLGTTEAAYWEGVHPDRKGEYMDEARRFLWLHGAICRSTSSMEIMGTAALRGQP